jgi:hypothetical protein
MPLVRVEGKGELCITIDVDDEQMRGERDLFREMKAVEGRDRHRSGQRDRLRKHQRRRCDLCMQGEGQGRGRDHDDLTREAVLAC